MALDPGVVGFCFHSDFETRQIGNDQAVIDNIAAADTATSKIRSYTSTASLGSLVTILVASDCVLWQICDET